MRSFTIAVFLALAGRAGASDVPKDKGVEPPAGAQSSTDTSTSQIGEASISRAGGVGTLDEPRGLFDAAAGRPRKPFDVGASWETHGLWWQNNTNAGNRKLFNFAYAYGAVNLTRNDRIRLRAGFYEYLLADQSESGLRATDISLSYSHLFRLPKAFDLRATVALTAPVSFYSQKEGLFTAPTAALSLSRVFGHGFAADLSLFGGAYLTKCSSAGASGYDCSTPGGAPNLGALFGGSLEADYHLWFHKPLSIGVDGYVAWLWNYDQGTPMAVTNNDYGYGPGVSPGVVGDPVYPHQPVQQLYGFELFLRYTPPVVYGIHTDVLVALAEGDPTLGYISRNIDGISHFFGDYYRTFELYGTLSFRY